MEVHCGDDEHGSEQSRERLGLEPEGSSHEPECLVGLKTGGGEPSEWAWQLTTTMISYRKVPSYVAVHWRFLTASGV